MLLDMVNDFYDMIPYYPGKVNVVFDDLSRKQANKLPLECCMRMAIFTPLLELLEKVYDVAFWGENAKRKRL